MDHQLKDIEARLPKDAPSDALNGVATTTLIAKRQAERMLVHMRTLEMHVNEMDNKLKGK